MWNFIWRRWGRRPSPSPHGLGGRRGSSVRSALRVPLELERLEDRLNPNATLNPLGGGLQIVISGADSVSLSAANGKLVLSDATAGQSIFDNAGKFAITGSPGSQVATENANLQTDFTSLTITGTGGGQVVTFIGGSFVATNVNDGTIPTVGFTTAASLFSGNLNVQTATSLTISAGIMGAAGINITAAGTNAALNVGSNVASQSGPINLQATGAVTVSSSAVNSGSGALTIAADVTPAGAGDDGVGTLTIGAFASVYGSTLTLRGADQDLASTAAVGSAVSSSGTTPSGTLTGNLFNPDAVAFDGSGNLYVANNGNNTVSRFAPGATTSTVALTGVSSPYALAFDHSGNLFVANSFTTTVSEVLAGATTAGVTLNGLNNPHALAFDTAGNLFVANFGNDTVSAFAPGATTPTATLAGLSRPQALAFDASGNLFVANFNNGTVSEFTPGATTASATLTGLNIPYALAFDGGGNLFVANYNANTVSKFAPGATTASATLTGLSTPVSIAFDAGGNLYVTNNGNSTVSKFLPGGTTAAVTLTGVNNPNAVAFDAGGNLYVANNIGNTVSKFNLLTISATTAVTVRSSLPTRPLSLGGSNNAAVAGINLTSAELARIATAATATVTLGDAGQTGPLSFTAATPASTAGAATVVVASGAAQIILDNSAGAALNGNGGSVTLTSGTGGVLEKATNNAGTADISNAATVSLSASGALGTGSQPLQLGGGKLTTDTSSSNANQFFSASVPVTLVSLNAGSGNVSLAGGTFALPVPPASNLLSAATVVLGASATLAGAGTVSAALSSSGTILPSAIPATTPGTLNAAGLTLNSGSTYKVEIQSSAAYDQTVVTSGTINVNGAKLNPVALAGATINAGDSYTIIKNSAGSSVIGNFKDFTGGTTLAEGALFVNFLGSGKTFALTYHGGAAGKDVVLAYAGPPTQFIISNLSPGSVTAGGSVSFTVTAEDSGNHTVPGYFGTVQLTSTDGQAAFNATNLPATYTFTGSDAGMHTFTVMLATAGSQTITVKDQANGSVTMTTSPISVGAGPFAKYVDTIFGSSTITADSSVLFTIQATDQFGNPVTSYSGPNSVTTSVNPTDPQGTFPVTSAINSSGFGFGLGTLRTVGTYTLVTAAGGFSGTSSTAIIVTPTSVAFFVVTAPLTAITGSGFSVMVQARDKYNNVVTGYGGTVRLTSNDPNADTLVSSYTFTTTGANPDNGTHTFTGVTLVTGGARVVSAADVNAINPTVAGNSGTVTTRGLVVTSLAPTADGFIATFNKAFVVADLALYGSTLFRLPDVVMSSSSTLAGTTGAIGSIHGSLLIDPANQSFTFKASSSYLALLNSLANNNSVVLPDGTYTVKLVGGSAGKGFLDALGFGLDGLNDGTAHNFTTTFATHYQANATPVLSIPDFARGPDGSHPIKVPNESASGIPVTLYNVQNLTDATFTLAYNSALLTVAGALQGAGSDATDPAGTLTMTGNSGGVATFMFHDATPQSGAVLLGDIVAAVPNSAVNQYQVKEQLQLNVLGSNGGAGTVTANAVHVNAYFGDVSADHKIDSLDELKMDAVAQGRATGFSPYVLLDPVVVGDIGGDAQIDSAAIGAVDAFLHQSSTQIPVPPVLTGYSSPNTADPTLSLPTSIAADSRGMVSVPILLDDPHPEGSTGMTEAVIALAYDPGVLSVTAADITLGSIPTNLGKGWQLLAVIDADKGQIGIQIYSDSPITTAEAGSLVSINFHIMPGAVCPTTAVQLVDVVTPNGQTFGTLVADDQGSLVLGQGQDHANIRVNNIASLDSVFAELANENEWLRMFLEPNTLASRGR